MAPSAAVADPENPAEAEARRLLAKQRERDADLARRCRDRAEHCDLLATIWRRKADELDPRPVPFEQVQIGDHVWLEDEWHRVLSKATRTDADGSSRELKVTRVHPAFYIPRTHYVADGELFTVGAF